MKTLNASAQQIAEIINTLKKCIEFKEYTNLSEIALLLLPTFEKPIWSKSYGIKFARIQLTTEQLSKLIDIYFFYGDIDSNIYMVFEKLYNEQ